MSENYIEFVDKIFERSDDPVEQLERMFDNHPLLFFIKEVKKTRLSIKQRIC